MDPDETLAQLREIGERNARGEFEFDREPLERALELVEALDGWIARGGALPAAWERR